MKNTTHNTEFSHQETLQEGLLTEGLGGALRYARETANLSRADVSDRLFLTVKTITAIENDDFANLPDPVFVRGYLRTYAKLVQLSEDEIIAAYNRLGLTASSSSRVRIPHDNFCRRQITFRDRPMRWITYLIACVLIVLVFLWWRNHHVMPTDVMVNKALIADTLNLNDMNGVDDGKQLNVEFDTQKLSMGQGQEPQVFFNKREG